MYSSQVAFSFGKGSLITLTTHRPDNQEIICIPYLMRCTGLISWQPQFHVWS